ncbi:hypothetical protein LTS07_011217 [Exophiala sideris]|uniref:Xylanolytic transcriptional activator regulatory domain-containing protein n=1 Tax=Exophiala sideris TaxID=1016849 RepID=A0ABR0IV78_9EURO|nr:hypothetical protein LTS07_011217 [Exophiala sideris]KAK5023741.1 hypothetical protein LTR13_011119 [Exophiala sideris]KAK5048820.1 hypothetical protein LTR69_011234 [Exophiala sideris]
MNSSIGVCNIEAAIDGGVYNEVERTLHFPSTGTLGQQIQSPFRAEDLFDENQLPTEHLIVDFDQPTASTLLFDLQFSPVEGHQRNLSHSSFSNIATNGPLQHGLNPGHSDLEDVFRFNHNPDTCEKGSKRAISGAHAENTGLSGNHTGTSAPRDAGSTLASEAHRTIQPVYSIDMPKDDATHLLKLFFEKVQPAFPLLHQPGVLVQYSSGIWNDEQDPTHLDFESALLLNGIFALAARFDERDGSWPSSHRIRENVFGTTAQALFDIANRERADEHLSLKYLQGCILLTYFQLTSRPSFQAWVLIGLCSRIGHALSLHQIDRDSTPSRQQQISDQEWSDKEEQRRAWWVIVQMDNFASYIGGRPPNIDLRRADVLLPVSDEDWFDLRPSPSALVSYESPATSWSSLVDTENQDAYAWFLVGNGLCRAAQEEFEKRDRSRERLIIIQSAIQCFLLGLPPRLRLSLGNMVFGERTFRETNWIIATHLVILSAKIVLGLGFQAMSTTRNQPQDSMRQQSSANEATSPSFSAGSPPQQHAQLIQEHMRAIRMWSPDYIPLASPLIANALVGPAAKFLDLNDVASALDGKLLEMVLKRFAEYWGIGAFCLELVNALRSSQPLEACNSDSLGSTWVQSTVQRAKFLQTHQNDWTA